MGGKSRPHRDSNPDRPARSQSLYRLSYRATHKQLPYTNLRRSSETNADHIPSYKQYVKLFKFSIPKCYNTQINTIRQSIRKRLFYIQRIHVTATCFDLVDHPQAQKRLDLFSGYPACNAHAPHVAFAALQCLFHADGKTDRHTRNEANIGSSKFCERAF